MTPKTLQKCPKKANSLESEVIYPMTNDSLIKEIVTVSTRHSMNQHSSIDTTINQANTMASCEPTVAEVDFGNEVRLFYTGSGICTTCSGWIRTSCQMKAMEDDIGKLRCICHDFDTHQF